MNKKKAQSAIEFVILVGFVLSMFTIFFLIIQENVSYKISERRDLEIKEIALTVRDEIDLASSSAEGYSRNFSLPEKISGKDYEINVNESAVSAITIDGKHAISYTVQNITGNLKKINNTIKKEDGIVKLNL